MPPFCPDFALTIELPGRGGRTRTRAKVMVDDFTFFFASIASITGLITPLWFAGLYLIRLWGDRRYPLHDESVPEPHDPHHKCDCGYKQE